MLTTIQDHFIVCGYGRIGSIIAAQLRQQNGILQPILAQRCLDAVSHGAAAGAKVGLAGKRHALWKHEDIHLQSEEIADGVVVFEAREPSQHGIAGICHTEL